MNYIKLDPIFQERVWGGRGLKEILNKQLTENKVIGESWEIVDRPEANSKVLNGENENNLTTLRQEQTEFLMGPKWSPEKPFPILVKWLDCQERLSLQVHPPAPVALSLKGEPKTENWYIVKTKPGAKLMAGLVNGVTKEQFEEALRSNKLEPLVHQLEVQDGDSLFVESGRIHAIGAGNLILEIQQNSDTTYRVYDWGRVGLDGNPRDLHIEESLASIDFDDYEPSILRPEGDEVILAESKEFRLRKINLTKGQVIKFNSGEEPRILSVVEGSIVEQSGESLVFGDNLILPYGGKSSWMAEVDSQVLITDRFTEIC